MDRFRQRHSLWSEFSSSEYSLIFEVGVRGILRSEYSVMVAGEGGRPGGVRSS